MNPPSVYDVTTPRSHKTNKTTKIVQSIYALQSYKKQVLVAPASLASHLELAFLTSQMTHARRF
jgi:hypothetical protein